MKEIRVSISRVALVDDVDHWFFSQFNWRVLQSGRGYAGRCERRDGKPVTITIHQEVIRLQGIVVPPDCEIDHKNRDTFDNQRHNLRVATRGQSRLNSTLGRNNTSGVCGVHWYERYGQWNAAISVRGQKMNLGYFNKFEDAVAARLNAERRYLGGEYTTNLPGTVADRAITN